MRQINDHMINPTNDTLLVTITDEVGSGGANHRYEITGMRYGTNVSSKSDESEIGESYEPLAILFQNGPILESGVNGVTHEVLLAIVADRLRSFQKGPFACKVNACALTHIEEAMHWLQQRTIERIRRGVEGTHQL